MKILGKKEFLDGGSLPKEFVPTPEIEPDSGVYVRGMDGTSRDKFEASIVQMKDQKTNFNMINIRAKLASMTICDEGGNLLFTEADMQALGKKSAIVLQRIFVVGQRLSGIGERDVEELTTGLQENPFDGSASVLP